MNLIYSLKKPAVVISIAVCALILSAICVYAQQTEPAASGAGTAAEDTRKQADGSPKDEGTNKEKDDDNMGWRVRDFKPYVTALTELQKLNKEYSENLLKLAIDEYSTGLDIIEDMEHEINDILTLNQDKKNLNERWYWQEIDRKNQERRQIHSKKQSAKLKAVNYFTRSIQYMDQVQSVEITKDQKFINFKIRLYQMYVSTNYDLGNLKPCIPILERYISISEKTKNDEWAYKYLASCYGYMESVLNKYKHSTEDEIMEYKLKKNRSMIQATEIKYGVDSPHTKHLREIVERDEKQSELINDFQ